MLTSHNFTSQSSIPGSARETCRARCLCAGLMLMLMSRSPVEPQSRNLGKFLMSRSLAELQTPSSGKFRGSPELLWATVLVRFRTFWADPGHLGPDFSRLGPLLPKKQSRRHLVAMIRRRYWGARSRSPPRYEPRVWTQGRDRFIPSPIARWQLCRTHPALKIGADRSET